jgi:hypothetical protein
MQKDRNKKMGPIKRQNESCTGCFLKFELVHCVISMAYVKRMAHWNNLASVIRMVVLSEWVGVHADELPLQA